MSTEPIKKVTEIKVVQTEELPAVASVTSETTTLKESPSEGTTTKETEKPAQKAAEVPTATATNTAGDDLDDLDDLLDDFADDILAKPPGSTVENKTKTTVDEPLNDEFTANIGDLIKDLNIEDPETKDQVENLIKQFELNHREEAETEAKKPANFEYVMKETMERLKKSGDDIDEKLKNDPTSGNPEDMLTQLLAGLGGAEGLGGADGDVDMSKLLVDMLEQLSSREVLYEPIKDLNTKFPDYLKEKQGIIPEHEHQNYTRQYEITNDILAVFDASDYNDDNKAQRDQINSYLESLQELGQPPTELIGEGDFPGFGGLGGLGLDGGAGGLDFNDKDLPQNFEKELEEGCKQQ